MKKSNKNRTSVRLEPHTASCFYPPILMIKEDNIPIASPILNGAELGWWEARYRSFVVRDNSFTTNIFLMFLFIDHTNAEEEKEIKIL